MGIDKKKKLLIVKLALIFSVLGIWIFYFNNLEVAFNNKKVTLWIHAPSIVEVDEKFEITVEAWDTYERLAGAYDKEISFDIESYNYSSQNLESITAVYDLPKDYLFTSNHILGGIYPAYKVSGADNGKKSFDLKIKTPGIHYIVVKERETGEEYRSNPIIVKPTVSKFLYWGDIHGHTAQSDGAGLVHEAYEFARDVALLDFAALTDHSEHFTRAGDIDIFNVFSNYIKATNSYNDDGDFSTLVAMEWTPYYLVRDEDVMHGHLNVYFEGDTMPFFSTLTHQNQKDLFDYLKEQSEDKFMSWTHHSLNGQFSSDFAYYDEEINRLIEVYSIHGSSEASKRDSKDDEYLYPQRAEINDYGYSIRDAFRMGRRMGIMASSDTHDGRIGHPISHTEADKYNQYPYTLSGYRIHHIYPGSLTGVFSSKLNRESIYNALYNRSCYATSWISRPYIEFSINNVSVGVNESVLVVPKANSTRTIEILICADGISMKPDTTTKIEKVFLFKNSEVYQSWENVNDVLFKKTVIDSENITGTEYTHCIKKDGKQYIHDLSIKSVNPDELNTNGFDYYYLRMQDSNGQAAWIGPIWVEYPK